LTYNLNPEQLSSAEVKGGVARGEVMIYLINAKEGQSILDFRF
jgi:hypothetical protein